jgi:ferredoxin
MAAGGVAPGSNRTVASRDATTIGFANFADLAWLFLVRVYLRACVRCGVCVRACVRASQA